MLEGKNNRVHFFAIWTGSIWDGYPELELQRIQEVLSSYMELPPGDSSFYFLVRGNDDIGHELQQLALRCAPHTCRWHDEVFGATDANSRTKPSNFRLYSEGFTGMITIK